MEKLPLVHPASTAPSPTAAVNKCPGGQAALKLFRSQAAFLLQAVGSGRGDG